ncbi:hypothetical protein QBC42DRAFT_280369 [Cladorrhinum samala]|uniref:Secreted protein n=1 Tax=Cladorrhinum samala TaxID=585594 RepID=A0AAV9H8V5_9PEZI|nr:hypothetical protein QBC42DRAFT_280369 [Cladorrhinum samala]
MPCLWTRRVLAACLVRLDASHGTARDECICGPVHVTPRGPGPIRHRLVGYSPGLGDKGGGRGKETRGREGAEGRVFAELYIPWFRLPPLRGATLLSCVVITYG